jgi:tetratricopeptide (TPR) repeat protein
VGGVFARNPRPIPEGATRWQAAAERAERCRAQLRWWSVVGSLWTILLLAGCADLPILQPAPTPTPTVQEQAADLYEQGNLLFDQGEYDQAIVAYDQALALDPTNAHALNNRALAHQARERFPEALADFQAAVTADPTYARAYKNRAALLERTGADPRQLAADYGRLAELEPQAAADHRYRQGVALHGQRDYAAARQAYDAALAADPQHVDALYERALLSIAEQNPADAVADLDRAIRLSPRAANAYYARAVARATSGDPRRARDDLDEALRLRPGYPEALLARADLALAAGDTAQTAADLDRLDALQIDDQLQAASAALRARLP